MKEDVPYTADKYVQYRCAFFVATIISYLYIDKTRKYNKIKKINSLKYAMYRFETNINKYKILCETYIL